MLGLAHCHCPSAQPRASSTSANGLPDASAISSPAPAVDASPADATPDEAIARFAALRGGIHGPTITLPHRTFTKPDQPCLLFFVGGDVAHVAWVYTPATRLFERVEHWPHAVRVIASTISPRKDAWILLESIAAREQPGGMRGVASSMSTSEAAAACTSTPPSWTRVGPHGRRTTSPLSRSARRRPVSSSRGGVRNVAGRARRGRQVGRRARIGDLGERARRRPPRAGHRPPDRRAPRARRHSSGPPNAASRAREARRRRKPLDGLVTQDDKSGLVLVPEERRSGSAPCSSRYPRSKPRRIVADDVERRPHAARRRDAFRLIPRVRASSRSMRLVPGGRSGSWRVRIRALSRGVRRSSGGARERRVQRSRRQL